MKNNSIFFLWLLIFSITTAYSQSIPLKREYRATWLTTVGGSDWPSSSQSSAQQQQSLIDLLDSLKAYGMNVVIFQVRSECDAMYKSDIEPWSIYLTGTQGKAPNPFYDPLDFAVKEAHKRGMELHAWFNPYRVKGGTFAAAGNYITNLHPNWIITIEGSKILNPGLDEVRKYVAGVLADVARRYDVDGIHMDDFFYPYPNPTGITNQDDSTFIKYPRGFTDRSSWRRDNVNLLIKMINDSVHAVKPNIKFGMSPFGIWKSGTPAGITGLSAYSEIFCDAIAWLQKKSVDYITPQLYWAIGGSQDYTKLMPWWADSAAANGRHFIPGMAAYRIASAYSASEIPNQIRLNRANPKTQGSVFFTTNSLLTNPKGVTDTMKNDLYRYPALRPIMSWHNTIPPNPPQNVRYAKMPGVGIAGLCWDLPAVASDGDTANMYVIYKGTSGTFNQAYTDNSANIYDITSLRSFPIKKSFTNGPLFFAVTALDQNCNESTISTGVQVNAPAIPTLVFPANGAGNQKDTIILKWYYAANAGSYSIQVSTDPGFSGTNFVNGDNLQDSLMLLTGMTGQTTYYWRVKSKNPIGESSFSAVSSFSTGFPGLTTLSEPAQSQTNVSQNPTLKWMKAPAATSYEIQFAKGYVGPTTIQIDTTVINDTTLKVFNLELNTAYFWRVRAFNGYGAGPWATQRGFKVTPTSVSKNGIELPKDFRLAQNYPNPFNPTTRIQYALPKDGKVRITVYDLLGNVVKELVNDFKNAGAYEVEWNAKDAAGTSVPSGIYFYQMVSGSFLQTQKMMLVK
ncbi:MAG: family 10 glycosylhydrolase [Ignavibacteria bacterium]|nr:family 10 glycosylhydrolase [Ignavibacteria bacterium]